MHYLKTKPKGNWPSLGGACLLCTLFLHHRSLRSGGFSARRGALRAAATLTGEGGFLTPPAQSPPEAPGGLGQTRSCSPVWRQLSGCGEMVAAETELRGPGPGYSLAVLKAPPVEVSPDTDPVTPRKISPSLLSPAALLPAGMGRLPGAPGIPFPWMA